MKRTPLIRRAPLRAKTPLKGGAPLERRTKLRKRGRKAGQRFERAFHSVGFVKWVKSLACSVPGCERTDIECAHVGKPRSRGGTWQEVAPLCAPHHRQQEKRTAAFNREHGVEMEWIAAAVALRWMAWTRDRETMGPRRPV